MSDLYCLMENNVKLIRKKCNRVFACIWVTLLPGVFGLCCNARLTHAVFSVTMVTNTTPCVSVVVCIFENSCIEVVCRFWIRGHQNTRLFHILNIVIFNQAKKFHKLCPNEQKNVHLNSRGWFVINVATKYQGKKNLRQIYLDICIFTIKILKSDKDHKRRLNEFVQTVINIINTEYFCMLDLKKRKPKAYL